MTRAISIAAAFAAMAGLTGCAGIEGRWKTVEAQPESLEGTFNVAWVEFKDDGAYEASVVYAEGQHMSAGAYTYANGKLTFADERGKTVTYDADVELGGELHVRGLTDEGEAWTVTMKKQ